MSFHEQTRLEIDAILRKAFAPLELEVVDESAAHRGHREAVAHPGAGHFLVTMKSKQFDGKNAVQRHRLVYEQLKALMDSRIHALRLNLKASNE